MGTKKFPEVNKMVKYAEDVQKKCVELAKNGTPLAEITRQLGPNPKAIQRYCVKAGVTLPKKKKVEKPATPAAAPAAPKKQ